MIPFSWMSSLCFPFQVARKAKQRHLHCMDLKLVYDKFPSIFAQSSLTLDLWEDLPSTLFLHILCIFVHSLNVIFTFEYFLHTLCERFAYQKFWKNDQQVLKGADSSWWKKSKSENVCAKSERMSEREKEGERAVGSEHRFKREREKR